MPDPNDELVIALGRRFIHRKDAKAIQHSNGSYEAKRSGLTLDDLRAHVAGTKTFGNYLLGPDDQCKLFAFDIDLLKTGTHNGEPFNPREAWQKGLPIRPLLLIKMRCLGEALARRTHWLIGSTVPIAVSYSGGKGMHVYGLTGPIPAAEARQLGREVLDDLGCFEPTRGDNFFRHTGGGYDWFATELYPKQDSLSDKDLGNLMRLPLGRNRSTGDAGFFVNLATGYDTLEADDPMLVLSEGSIRGS